MMIAPVRTLLLTCFLALHTQAAYALSCALPGVLLPPIPIDGPLPSEEEMQRFRSVEIWKFIQVRQDADFVVVGHFSKTEATPFLHEQQLENIRALYRSPSQNTQMPARIDYTYFDAYRFEGHQILNGELVPFSDESIDIRISMFADYAGLADALPPTSGDVIGVLRPSPRRNRLEIVALACHTYIPIESSQLADLLTCIRDGECR